MQVALSVRELGNYPAHGEHVEPLEPLERTDPVMNATVETVGLIFFKIVRYWTAIRFEPA